MEWFFVALAIIIVIVILWAIAQYNRLITLRNLVQEAWRQIDVELQRRHDLIPNLVETVKGYAKHERETLEAVIQARSVAVEPGSSHAQQAKQENVLSQALGRLFALAENYPDLKANQNFLELQRELADTEDRLAASRRIYNANVRSMNTKVETFPTSVVAGMFSITREDYFEVQDAAVRQTPNVQF
ncbi:LemA family protein [Demequina activiva]|uniref:LemA family protein n=1 Tax=Demequina activiva TaxID=1582364 RepID=A0A919Q342_9MICO|nr:LemA family protein [Demequina activiva]GIG54006.1 LemA family protein [Demequina activiva]